VFGGLRGCLRSVAKVVFGEFVVRFARFRLRESSRIVSEVSAAACVNIMGKFLPFTVVCCTGLFGVVGNVIAGGAVDHVRQPIGMNGPCFGSVEVI